MYDRLEVLRTLSSLTRLSIFLSIFFIFPRPTSPCASSNTSLMAFGSCLPPEWLRRSSRVDRRTAAASAHFSLWCGYLEGRRRALLCRAGCKIV